ncbi:helix-turn-helix domain-containing protein [Mycolicibacterium baixiangningiae]|uniref:helix-turn-helix domain-containing protein n=1 Tax=Mycolicibacterium baixiangningiae TaxID=2761578 RepID=UPI0018D171E4|nr:helix-turn-helix domain-containing protein [Mycolicibacterium baixiangningiae]
MENAQMLVAYSSARSLLGGIGRTTLYALIDAGEIQRVKIGNRAFVTARSITDYVERLSATPEVATHVAA